MVNTIHPLKGGRSSVGRRITLFRLEGDHATVPYAVKRREGRVCGAGALLEAIYGAMGLLTAVLTRRPPGGVAGWLAGPFRHRALCGAAPSSMSARLPPLPSTGSTPTLAAVRRTSERDATGRRQLWRETIPANGGSHQVIIHTNNRGNGRRNVEGRGKFSAR